MTNVELRNKLADLFVGKSWRSDAFNVCVGDLSIVYPNVEWRPRFTLGSGDKTVLASFAPLLTPEQLAGFNLRPWASWNMANEVKEIIKNSELDNLFMRREGCHSAILRISIRNN